MLDAKTTPPGSNLSVKVTQEVFIEEVAALPQRHRCMNPSQRFISSTTGEEVESTERPSRAHNKGMSLILITP